MMFIFTIINSMFNWVENRIIDQVKPLPNLTDRVEITNAIFQKMNWKQDDHSLVGKVRKYFVKSVINRLKLSKASPDNPISRNPTVSQHSCESPYAPPPRKFFDSLIKDCSDC